MEITLEGADWNHIWLATKSSCQNSVAIETNYKVLTRCYLVPARIAKYVPQYPSACFRGCSTQGHVHHIWCSCPIVQTFWSNLFSMLSTLFDTALQQPYPSIAILNLKLPNLSQCQFKLLLQVTTAAKQIIAKSWKTPSLCSCGQKQGYISNGPCKN